MSFEHDFFLRIARDFPLLRKLIVRNIKAQKHKRSRQTYDEQAASIVVFPHLNALDLNCTCVDYAEQFLFDTNTHMPCLSILRITYENLLKVTDHFTSDAARLNCHKVECLILDEGHAFVHPKDFYVYFPLL